MWYTHVFLYVSGFLLLLPASLGLMHKVTYINVEIYIYIYFFLFLLITWSFWSPSAPAVNHREKSCPFFHIHNVLFLKLQYKDKRKKENKNETNKIHRS